MKKIGNLEFSKNKFITEKLKKCTGNVFLYGAANCAESIFKYLKKIQKIPKQVIVDDKYFKQKLFHKIPVIKKSEFINKQHNGTIIVGIGTSVPKPFKKQKNSNTTLPNIGFARGPVIDPAFAQKKWNKYKKLYNKLGDDKSKKTFVYFLKSKMYGENCDFKKIKAKNHFLNEKQVPKNKYKIFCDCGAYDGDTIESFRKAVKNNFKKIYAWEPDKKNLKILRKKIKKLRTKKIEVLDQCAFDRKGYLSFDSLGSPTSFVKKTGLEKVRCNKIDNCCPDSEIIKMDVEGCEIKALSGATNTIRKNRPLLAIAIYHRRDDILSLSNKILKIHRDYKFYLRAYRDVADDVILYAI